MQKELFEKAKSLREEQETVEDFIALLKSSRRENGKFFRDICVIDTADDIVCVSDINETLYNVLMIALEAEHKRLEESFEKL